MISIIPEREILKSVTDKNINSPASKVRVNAFQEANFLKTKSKDVEIVIEGILFSQIELRLDEQHKKVFNCLYEIDNSAINVIGFDITRAIKFIAKRKLNFPRRNGKIIIITENLRNYNEMLLSNRLKAFTSQEFIERTNKFKNILNDYDAIYDALITSFFIE